MPITTARLRLWLATAAILLAVLVAGFYFYGRMRVRRAIGEVPRNLGINIQQSTHGFTLSKSEAGHTLFTIHASRAVQYKEGGKAELRDVSIVVYGRRSNRYDQIYGSDFEYDPQSGEVTATGEVHIDLEGNAGGPLNPDQSPPPELKNPIHVKTSGLTFNAKTGLANTRQRIEFRIPQANGAALGAAYDSKAATLTLDSNIVVHSGDDSHTTITARHGVVTKGPNRAVLDSVRVARDTGNFSSDQLTVYLRDDNTIERLLASGDVRADAQGRTAAQVRSSRAEAWITPKNALRSALFSGAVQVNSTGEQSMRGTAGKLTINFAGQNRVDKIIAADGVDLLQEPARGKSAHPVEIAADTIDFVVQDGRTLQRAVTGGPAKVTVLPAAGSADAGQTVATAGRFEARFNPRNRVDSLSGSPDVKVVLTAPGQPDKTSTSDSLQVAFEPSGAVGAMLQDGHFHYTEPGVAGGSARAAWAEHARYTPADQVLTLTGSPRVVEGGLTTTAQVLRLDRRSGDAAASGDVKSTYSELKARPGGALLASSDPIHVTAPNMRAQRSSGTAVYSGGARLWQGSSIVEAPLIEFNRADGRLLARSLSPGSGSAAVTTTFIQQDQNAKTTPLSIRAAQLSYIDSERKARFSGGVLVRGADTTLSADVADVYLQARGQNASASGQAAPSQIGRIVAEGKVNLQQPNRRATGDKLVYTASEGKFVLVGGPPSIFDAERGKITGGSLTFFNRDDRVVVESGSSAPTVTQTRVAK